MNDCGKYRKYIEPEYGDAAPEVQIGEPQHMDMAHPKEWRERTNKETIIAITAEIKRCGCYRELTEVRTEEVTVDADGGVFVRIYYPETVGDAPLMLFCHGGAFSMNTIDIYDPVNRYFAKYGGMITVAVEYRLAPEYPYPYGLTDCYRALEWLAANGKRLGGNPGHIIVCGDSSGGNYAAALSLMARDKKGPKVWKQALIYPLTAVTEEEKTKSEKRYGKGYFLEYDRLEELADSYVPEDMRRHPYVSPLYAEDLTDLPGAFFFCAECDPLLDQGLQYAARLKDAGNEVEVHIYQGMIHAFLNKTYEKTFEMLDDICQLGTG